MTPQKHEQCFDFNADLSDIERCIKEGHRIVISLRGVTGSGKTTLAQKLINLSSDRGFQSVYLSFGEGDTNNQVTKSVRSSLSDNHQLIVIDAENVERADIKKVSIITLSAKYEFFLVEPKTAWKHNAHECQLKSTRDEDISSIQRKIKYIREEPINWDHLAGGKSSVTIRNYYDDYASSTPASPVSSSSSLLSLSDFPAPASLPKSPFVPMFSLAPIRKTKIMRTMSTNITMECLAHELAGYESNEGNGCFTEKEEIVDVIEKGNHNMIERKTQTEEIYIGRFGEKSIRPAVPLFAGDSTRVGFAMLCCVFPHIDALDLRHYVQLNGYVETFRLLKILGEETYNPLYIEDNGLLIDELENEESYTFYSNSEIEEELEERRKERSELHFLEEIEGIYIPEETENDEEIARILHSQLNDSEFMCEEVENDQSVARLAQIFSLTDRVTIIRAYEASSGNLDMAYSFLLEMGEQEVQAKKSTWSNKVASLKPKNQTFVTLLKKTEKEESNHFLKQKVVRDRNLEQVQADAIRLRRKIEMDRMARASFNPSANSEFRRNVMMDRTARLRSAITEEVRRIDTKIRDAHSNPWNLDLHYMSVDGASNLVLEAIEAVRYYLKSGTRVQRRIKVVTGSGNNSRNGAKIRPRIEQLLKNHKISFENLNNGCFEIKIS
uniref:Smr domain-containing protein n=1 Tax=Caenorhabditis tropicalis TaxID=1561998 RepID=A0A1I7TEM5_9PELO